MVLKLLLAIDGNSVLNRAFYGVRPLTNSEGFLTNAIYGFYGIVMKILKEVEPTHVLVAFDLKAKTFRHKKYELYKANRKQMPQELFLQLVEVKKMLNLMGICVCEKEGFEADDLLGTISRICKEQLFECLIASGDRDVLQLVNRNVKVRLLTNVQDVLFDEAAIEKKFGVCANQLVDVKALMGDASDNIPGVRGIGEKTALKLISEFHDVNNLFDNLDILKISPRVRNLLSSEEARKMCFLSKELGTICLFAGLDENLNSYLKRGANFYELKAFLEKHDLNKFLKNLNGLDGKILSKPLEKTAEEPFDQFCFKKKFEVFVDIDLNVAKKKLDSIDFLNFFFFNDELFIVSEVEIFKFIELKLEAFKVLIVESRKPKRTTDLKQVYKFCLVHGFNLTNVSFACEIASYLINVLQNSHDILSLAENLFHCDDVAECFLMICHRLQKQIEEKNLGFLLNKVELPLVKVLAEMEYQGFGVDREKLANFGNFLSEQIEVLKKEIWSFCGKQFNINSTKELSDVLFNDLKLPKTRKIKTGYSTDADSLLSLVKYSEVVPLILNYRAKTKLYSTYVVGLQKVIGLDGRIHSSFNQTQTRTGRISSLEPNIQNIPIKTELGCEMRKFFVAKKGFVLVDGDYSQIELRILADMADDEKMIDAFKMEQDIHKLTASKIFGVEMSSVSDELRRRAKTVNFSVIYGIGAFSLAKDIGVSVAVAKTYIESFFKCYSKIEAYFNKVVETAKETGEVKTKFGRIRKIPELNSRLKKTVALGERIAKNTPIQGTCADLIKIAMINITKRLKEKQINANLILQVHDELLIEAEESCSNEVKLILKQEMENVAKLKVPLIAKVRVGKTWFDC